MSGRMSRYRVDPGSLQAAELSVGTGLMPARVSRWRAARCSGGHNQRHLGDPSWLLCQHATRALPVGLVGAPGAASVDVTALTDRRQLAAIGAINWLSPRSVVVPTTPAWSRCTTLSLSRDAFSAFPVCPSPEFSQNVPAYGFVATARWSAGKGRIGRIGYRQRRPAVCIAPWPWSPRLWSGSFTTPGAGLRRMRFVCVDRAVLAHASDREHRPIGCCARRLGGRLARLVPTAVDPKMPGGRAAKRCQELAEVRDDCQAARRTFHSWSAVGGVNFCGWQLQSPCRDAGVINWSDGGRLIGGLGYARWRAVGRAGGYGRQRQRNAVRGHGVGQGYLQLTIIDPPEAIRCWVKRRGVLVSDPFAGRLAGFSKDDGGPGHGLWGVARGRVVHAVPDSRDQAPPAPDGHAIEPEPGAKTATGIGHAGKHVDGHLAQFVERMHMGKWCSGRRCAGTPASAAVGAAEPAPRMPPASQGTTAAMLAGRQPRLRELERREPGEEHPVGHDRLEQRRLVVGRQRRRRDPSSHDQGRHVTPLVGGSIIGPSQQEFDGRLTARLRSIDLEAELSVERRKGCSQFGAIVRGVA